ncbi:MAG: hypothetical protein OXQ89_02720 [Rhodospirillaceae bacterium]|nr:hypothetical protein [Rhodospirillaceae bacterium]
MICRTVEDEIDEGYLVGSPGYGIHTQDESSEKTRRNIQGSR